MELLTCSRCGENKPGLDRPPIPGADGDLIHRSVCADCWAMWGEEEVRTINELRLNFMDPEAQATLRTRMLAYLGLSSRESESAGSLDPLCDRGETEPES